MRKLYFILITSLYYFNEMNVNIDSLIYFSFFSLFFFFFFDVKDPLMLGVSC